jgi:hypothetical protein
MSFSHIFFVPAFKQAVSLQLASPLSPFISPLRQLSACLQPIITLALISSPRNQLALSFIANSTQLYANCNVVH